MFVFIVVIKIVIVIHRWNMLGVFTKINVNIKQRRYKNLRQWKPILFLESEGVLSSAETSADKLFIEAV
jgi:hypothetical protein